jgi:hypothetical protein
MSRRRKVNSEDLVAIPFRDLYIHLTDFGTHRGRKYGVGEVFGYWSLDGLRFDKLAKKVKAAYEGKDVPDHKGWKKQREALRWLVDQGEGAMYEFKKDIWVFPRSDRGTYYINDGHHRALALYILGADGVRAAME